MWPDGPSQSRVAHGFRLIPVSGVGEAVGGVSEAVGDEKIRKRVSKVTFDKDMANDEMTFEAHKQIGKPLSRTCTHIWRASVRSEKVRVCVRAREVFVCTHPRRVHGNCNCLEAKLPERRKNLRSAQDYTWSPDSGDLDNN